MLKINIIVVFALTIYTFAVDAENATIHALHHANDRDKRDVAAESDNGPVQFYRAARRQMPVAPVQETHDGYQEPVSRSDTAEYRPGQVFSLNAQELLELQPERKAPLASTQQLQQIYAEPQPEHKQNLQQFYYVEPQGPKQVLQPSSHAVIARPDQSSDGGEASVGAALSVSDTRDSPSGTFDQELLALLGQGQARPELFPQASPTEQAPIQSAPQYQQIDRFSTKPSKKPTKLRSKSHFTPPQASSAPQQYLIETTNVQHVQPEQQTLQQRYQPTHQPQRSPQALRYIQVPAPAPAQQLYYEYPEQQGIKVVAAPKLQQARNQLNYRIMPYQQPEITPKQYRVVEAPRISLRQEQARIQSPSNDRPVAYLKRFQEPEKLRSVKFYAPAGAELSGNQQPSQVAGDQYYIRQVYRPVEVRDRHVGQSQPLAAVDQSRIPDQTKPAHSSIYVSKNIMPKKLRPENTLREQPSRIQQVSLEQYGHNIDVERSELPPPRNNKAYTPEEFSALVAAGYSVTPIPVSALSIQEAQSRSDEVPVQRRPYRGNPYLPLRANEGH